MSKLYYFLFFTLDKRKKRRIFVPHKKKGDTFSGCSVARYRATFGMWRS